MNKLFPLLLISTLYSYPKEENRYKYHIGINFTITLGSYYILNSMTFKERLIHSVLPSTIIGTTKEYIDLKRGGKFDTQDITHNTIGTMAGLLLAYSLNN